MPEHKTKMQQHGMEKQIQYALLSYIKKQKGKVGMLSRIGGALFSKEEAKHWKNYVRGCGGFKMFLLQNCRNLFKLYKHNSNENTAASLETYILTKSSEPYHIPGWPGQFYRVTALEQSLKSIIKKYPDQMTPAPAAQRGIGPEKLCRELSPELSSLMASPTSKTANSGQMPSSFSQPKPVFSSGEQRAKSGCMAHTYNTLFIDHLRQSLVESTDSNSLAEMIIRMVRKFGPSASEIVANVRHECSD